MSTPYRFDLETSAEGEGSIADLLGQPARLVTRSSATAARVAAGVVTSAAPGVRTGAAGGALVRVRIMPRLALLKFRRTSRVFQEQSVQGIVTQVLTEAGVEHEWRIARPGPLRAYCLQYQETDLAFVTRILAEEGLFYWFAQPDEADARAVERVILADNAEAHEVISGGENLVVRSRSAEWSSSTSDDEVARFDLRAAARSARVSLSDYDFQRPLLKLTSEDAGDGGAIAGLDLGVYLHRGEYDVPEVTRGRARTELEQQRRRAAVGVGESNCRRLTPGYGFHLEVEGSPALSGEYVVTALRHTGADPRARGGAGEVYRNELECAPKGVPFRPAPPKRRLRQVLESAIVVGPEGDEIHTDEHGRVKIQFHWDREGQANERSSCWIRTTQVWSGASWGFQFVPRIGMEVLVTFLGGDQDCPVVIGCAPNATHPVPFKLPEQKTRSGIRTRSTPRSAGANELSFEDAAGEEELLVVAQRDLVVQAKHDHTESIANHQKVIIGVDQSVGVGADRLVTVGGNRTEIVRGDASTKVEGSESVKVEESRRVVVGTDLSTQVGHDLDLRVDGRGTLVIGTKETPSVGSLDAHGDVTLGASGSARVTAVRSIRLRVGESVLEIGPDEIKLESKAITLIGSSSVSAVGKGPALHLTDKAVFQAKSITLKTPEAFLELEKDAKLKGKLVKLNCDDLGDDEDKDSPPAKPKSFRVKVADDFHKPYADKPYELLVEGTVYEGQTDTDGMVEQDLPPTAVSGELTLWLKEKGQRPKLSWQLKLGDLPPMDTPLGVRTRLKNLGYLRVVEKQSDGVEIEAIKAFQRDHGLPATGVVDDATKSKLTDSHGH